MAKAIHVPQIELFSFVTITALVSTVLVIHNNQNNQKNFHIITPIIENNTSQTLTATPTPVPTDDIASQISPDGTKQLIMKTTHTGNGTLLYTFVTKDISANHEQQIYSIILNGNETMKIPFNTWSPDNKYVFIVRNSTDVMVFNASGMPFVDTEPYLDATDVFIQHNTGNILSEATGWASPTLIIINTTTPDTTKGPSYWFEVPSKALIRLSTEF